MAGASSFELRRSFFKILVLPALTFLLVPLLAVGFIRYGEARIDGEITASILANIDRAALSAEEKAAARSFVAEHPASRSCTDPDPRVAKLRRAVCDTWDPVWQFAMAERVAAAAAALGVAALLGVALLGLIAFWSRRAQHWSFMLGWRALVAVTVVETVAQGALLTWLSYWVTALVFDRYFPKLIAGAGIVALFAVAAIVKALLRRPPAEAPLEAEAVTEADAPNLWARVRELARRIGTEPPATIAAGVDDNFFVTEHPLPLRGGEARPGRLLYASLPLLRTLSPSEADAVLGHELAHFKGGDTAASARLHPMLVRYAAYASTLAEGGLTVPAGHVMRLYRAIFELALKREARRRELIADAEASRLTTPDDLGRALLKIVGYSSFRAATEEQLFAQQTAHADGLGLRQRIDAGLPAHAASPGFLEHVRATEVPHPFDSHPPLEERLAAAGATTRLQDAAALLAARPERTWADDVPTADDIEGRLWAAYEGRFRARHDESLAWRYLPSTEAQRAHVLRYFPDRSFPRKQGGEVRVTHAAVIREDGATIAFSEIASAKVQQGTFTHELTLTRRKELGGPRTFKVKLGPLGKGATQFKAAFGLYWRRDQVARAAAEERSAEERSAGA